MMTQTNGHPLDLARITLNVLIIVGLIFTSFWIVRPFLTAFVWASMIVISTWPLLVGVQARLWGRRSLAATFLTCVLALVLILPLGLLVVGLAGNMDRIVELVQSVRQLAVPSPPDWLARTPLWGPKLAVAWERVASEGVGPLTAKIRPFAAQFLQWLVYQIGSIGAMILQFLLTIIISAILYMKGDTVGRGLCLFAHRVGGESGEKAALLAANSIRAVAMGVVVTAIVQATLAGIALGIAAVPGTLLLAALVFLFCVAQLGPGLVMLPVAGWKFYEGDTVWGIILLILALVIGTVDNLIRPILIKKGSNLPLFLIFSGVIGGLMVLGIVGIFVGPAILAVSYTLLKDWVNGRTEPVPRPRGSVLDGDDRPVIQATPLRH
jgi:predicted PurR-regulated permease PerM